jgi:hypothetical protein
MDNILSEERDNLSQLKKNIDEKNMSLSNKVSVSEYQRLTQERDKYIKNNWDDSHMDPNKYFVLNQKNMFQRDINMNRF